MSGLVEEIQKFVVALQQAQSDFVVVHQEYRVILERKSPGFEVNLAISFMDQDSGVIARPTIVASIDAVASFYERVLGPGQYSGTVNAGLFGAWRFLDESIDEFDPNAPNAWPIRSAADVAQLANSVPKYLQDVVHPYSEQVNDPAKVAALLNKNLSVRSVHLPFNPLRAEVGMITAFLSGASDLNTALIHWAETSKQWSSPWPERFQALHQAIRQG